MQTPLWLLAQAPVRLSVQKMHIPPKVAEPSPSYCSIILPQVLTGAEPPARPSLAHAYLAKRLQTPSQHRQQHLTKGA
eukprot:scaffold60844_cov21-Tisochrysis_lutea.AAC.3